MQDAKILIVEDESIIALDIKMSLQHAGYAIAEIARSGGEAIALAQSQQPDLILMDIRLQGPMDGIEAAQKIREQQSCPVVYLTAHTDSQTLDRAKLTAPFGYLTKPFDDHSLMTTIEIALARYASEQAIREALVKQREFNELRSRFVAVVSHEFRNPLNTILFSTELLHRYEKDCFSYCECYVIRLPTATSKTLTIVGYQRYARGELITLTANSPDTEFDQNYLICDFRTSKLELNESLVPGNNGIVSQWQKSNPEYVGFGGLPALIQFPHPGYTIQANTILQYMPRYYKPESVWTAMDKVHNQLQESPRIFSPLSTVLPPNVFPAVNFGLPAVIFDLDGKFGRGGRPELIDFPNNFGDNGANAYKPNIYTSATRFTYPHLISYKEQLVGNGLIKNGVISKWYRVTNSSFPIGDQTKRNYP